MLERGDLKFEGGLSPEAMSSPETAEHIVTTQECDGHFKDGAKILPAFRMLSQLVNKMASHNETPNKIHMEIGDILPEGVSYTSEYTPGDPLNTLVLNRRSDITITGTPKPLDVVYQSDLFKKHPDAPIKPDRILLNSDEIQSIIPQGENIQFIDAVITTDPEKPTVIAEAIHMVTPAEYEQLGASEYYYYDPSSMLEGLGQLAYIHFQQTISTDKPMTPFFKEVTGNLNTDYQPQIGEVINYQLTHFETDFAERGDKGSGMIAGQILASNGARVLANFVATVGAMEQSRLAKLADLARRQSAKPITPEKV